MKRAVLTATLLLPTLFLFSLGQDKASPTEPRGRYSEHVIWSSSHPDRTEFIPVAQLQEAARSSLPVDPGELYAVEVMIRLSRAHARQGEEIDCEHSSGVANPRPSSDARSFVDLLQFLPFTGYGAVTEVVLGLARGHVVTMVYVEVEEIWGCQRPGGAWLEETCDCPEPAGTRTIAVGDVVAVLQQKGRIEVDGEILCEATDEILDTPKVGTKIVFGGGTFAVIDPHFIGRGLLFPVADGQILPEPYEWLSERVAQPFAEVRAQMQPGLQTCEGPDTKE